MGARLSKRYFPIFLIISGLIHWGLGGAFNSLLDLFAGAMDSFDRFKDFNSHRMMRRYVTGTYL